MRKTLINQLPWLVLRQTTADKTEEMVKYTRVLGVYLEEVSNNLL